ncbi:hypothetical protein LTR56_007984 [Elasticomyces elasticus]|nr:hypothetical protein LTR22_020146 [Elasticomyces elasticus]KAK3647490.1 hypothetical protein LTR56_007984 [Elasticomyces elasticus]KAK4910686.1 hypothetical protein LTR49_020625 [Elasticomyces elasticus]KAK5735056.1 hypothetical protein LTS12_026554 [Elasticomyces elasticus]
MFTDYLTDGFADMLGRPPSEWTFERLAKLASDFTGVRGCVYFAFGDNQHTPDEPDMVGYCGVAGAGEARRVTHLCHILQPRIFGKGQNFHQICRERGIIPDFALVGRDENLGNTPPHGARESFESTGMMMLSLLHRSMAEKNTAFRSSQVKFAASAQPPDMVGFVDIFFGCNFELAIFKGLSLSTTYALWPCTVQGCTEPDFISRMAAEHHLEVEHNLPPLYFMCQQEGCTQAYSSMAHIVRHERTHTEDRPFICGDCGIRTSTQSNLTIHARDRCTIALAQCAAPGCQTSGTAVEVYNHSMVDHDYCRGCESVLTYNSEAVSTYGTLTMRQQHICNAGPDIITYQGLKCTKTADCSFACGIPAQRTVHEARHEECEWLCGHLYPVAAHSGITQATKTQHAGVCPTIPTAERDRLVLHASGTMCGIGNPPCHHTLSNRTAARENHLASHHSCNRREGCQHRFPLRQNLLIGDTGQTSVKVPLQLEQELRVAHINDGCPSIGSTPTPVHLRSRRANPSAPISAPIPTPLATPVGNHTVPTLRLSERQRIKQLRATEIQESTSLGAAADRGATINLWKRKRGAFTIPSLPGPSLLQSVANLPVGSSEDENGDATPTRRFAAPRRSLLGTLDPNSQAVALLSSKRTAPAGESHDSSDDDVDLSPRYKAALAREVTAVTDAVLEESSDDDVDLRPRYKAALARRLPVITEDVAILEDLSNESATPRLLSEASIIPEKLAQVHVATASRPSGPFWTPQNPHVIAAPQIITDIDVPQTLLLPLSREFAVDVALPDVDRRTGVGRLQKDTEKGQLTLGSYFRR